MSTEKQINIDREPPRVLNMDDPQTRFDLAKEVHGLRGLYKVTLEPRKRARTLSQNSFYWAAYIPVWLAWLRETQGDPTISGEDAHYMLMDAVLEPREVINRDTGEIVGTIPHRSSKMAVEEFNVYLDKARLFIKAMCDFDVMGSEEYYGQAA